MRLILCIVMLVFTNIIPVVEANRKHSATIENRNVHADLIGKAYYIDFDVDTYAPITVNNVKQLGAVALLNNKQMITIEQIISGRQKNTNKHFDGLKVRLMLKKTKSHTTIFVDKEGVILAQGAYYSLTPRTIVRLNNYLNNLTKKNVD